MLLLTNNKVWQTFDIPYKKRIAQLTIFVTLSTTSLDLPHPKRTHQHSLYHSQSYLIFFFVISLSFSIFAACLHNHSN